MEKKHYLSIVGMEIVLDIFLLATLFKHVGWLKSSLCVGAG